MRRTNGLSRRSRAGTAAGELTRHRIHGGGSAERPEGADAVEQFHKKYQHRIAQATRDALVSWIRGLTA